MVSLSNKLSLSSSDLISNSALNFNCVLTEWLAFIGAKAAPGLPGSPFLISFKSSVSDSSGMKPMNESVYSCSDTSLGCSCGDCPLSSSCSDSEPPSPSQKESCSIRIGSLKVVVYAMHTTSFIDPLCCFIALHMFHWFGS